MKKTIAFALALLLAACATHRPAPVIERTQPPPPVVVAPPPAPQPPPAPPIPTHTVKKGDTLVSIALQYGLDYRDLVAWNSIANPNRIEIGQVLMLASPAGAATPLAAGPVTTPLAQATTPIEARPLGNTPASKVEPRAAKVPFSDRALAQMNAPDAGGSPVAATPPETPVPSVTPTAPVTPPLATPPVVAPPVAAAEPEKSAGTDNEDVDWIWPVKGKVLAPFTDASKGMDIAGKKGAPVLAAAAGRVVYAGVGLRGYGKLVIIKHNNTWLSAYAHNDNILVKEQQDVKKGQKIAEMGSTDSDQVMLHFEVRRQGKPVDPAKYLPSM
ncbi:MAG TPA: peptidoglycan DD-metalloendopeptidase family protein [Usitatibacter sp.]|nr:peptidoglycan DD-metalloendopeptidase family protein [Usitatibacter sp.]